MPVDLRPIAIQRAEIGLSSPTNQQKRKIWSTLSVPEAGIYEKDGGYIPFRLMERVHDHPARTKLITGGIRSSKSLGSAMEVMAWLPHADLVWLAGDTYDLTRQEFDYVVEACLSKGWCDRNMITRPRNRSMPCQLTTYWGTRVETRSLHDVNTFVARAPDLIVVCEPGLADPRVFIKASERLSTRRGLLWMAGTFEEVRFNWMEEFWHAWAKYPNNDNAKSFTIPTWHNTVTYPGGKNDPEILLLKQRMEPHEFLLRCAGVPVPAPNLVMADVWDKNKLLKPYEFERVDSYGNLVPVQLAIDPGYSNGYYAVEVIQYDSKGVAHIFDEVARQTELHEDIIEACKDRPWWGNVSGGTTDPHAEKHIFGSATTGEIWWSKARVKLRIPERLHVSDSIARLKAMMKPIDGKGLMTIDPICERLVWEMSHWRRKQSKEGYGAPTQNNCDGIKAMAYFFVDRHASHDKWQDVVTTKDYKFTNVPTA